MTLPHESRSFVQKVVDLYIYSSMHIGLCALSLTLFYQLALGKEFNTDYLICLFFATIALYNLHRLVGIAKVKAFNSKGRFKIIVLYKSHISFYFILAFIFATYYFLQLALQMQILLAAVSLISGAYTLPIYKGHRLRDLPYIKIILIAFSWTLLCLNIPMYNQSTVFEHIAIAVPCLLFFIGITIPFDIRDLEVDKSLGVKTVATRFGRIFSIRFAFSLLILSAGIGLGLFFLQLFELSTTITWITINLLTIIYLHRFHDKVNDWYFSLGLDGMIGLFYPTILLIQALIG